MHVIKLADAPSFELPGVRFTGMAAPSRGSAGLCTWRIAVAPGLVSPAPHTLDRDEVFMVTRGTLRLGPGTEPIAAGDTAVVPAGTPILLTNAADTEAEAIVVIAAGFTARGDDGAPMGTPPWAR
jgi:mannose-6-phosphate isomerase-like protein (cupin superfamily)